MKKTQSYLIENDVVLAQIISRIPLPTFQSTQNVFNDLMSCVIEQQIHYRSTKKVFEKLLAKAEIQTLTFENFPVFEEKALSTFKLSAKKYETIHHILVFWQEHPIDWTTLSDSEIIQHLKSIKGIGPWTIDMLLIYTFQRENYFAFDDFHIKRTMISLYGLNEKSKLKAQMKAIAEHWKPYQSLAFLYLLEWKQ